MSDDTFESSVKAVAERLRTMVKKGEIIGTDGKKIKETMVAVAVDNSTGHVYYGVSGTSNNPTVKDRIAQWLSNRMENVEPIETWDIDNCAEFNAINAALLDNANIENLVVYSVYRQSGRYREPCRNCRAMYDGFISYFLK